MELKFLRIFLTKKKLLFAVAPVCVQPSRRTEVVERSESARVSCEVEAFPANVNFTWKFNGSSSDGEALPLHYVVHSQGTSSFLNYSVQVEKDFGTLLCWASNAVGVQDEPCIVHVIPAGESESKDGVREFNLVRKFGFKVKLLITQNIIKFKAKI